MTAGPATIRRQTRGARVAFFDDPAIDQVMTYVVELAAEVSVLRDRQAVLETLLEQSGALVPSSIEAFVPEPEQDALRQKDRRAFVERVFRTHLGMPGRGAAEDEA